MVRIGVISDIHGSILPLESIFKEMLDESVDSIICCGDLVAFGPNPGEVLNFLDSMDAIQIIRGNTDRWIEMIVHGERDFEEPVVSKVEASLRWTVERLGKKIERFVNRYPPSLDLEYEGKRILVRHGSMDSDTDGVLPNMDLSDLERSMETAGCDIFLCGHTHVPFTRVFERKWIVNCGSTGMPLDLIPKPSWALLAIEKNDISVEIFRIDYNSDKVIADLQASGMPRADIFVERIKRAKF
jgi:putative phosphoesterase